MDFNGKSIGFLVKYKNYWKQQKMDILDRCQVQVLGQEVLICCDEKDFALLVRNRKDIPSALSLDKAKVTLSCHDGRVTSFDVVGQRVQC
jgi:hypothetical protein